MILTRGSRVSRLNASCKVFDEEKIFVVVVLMKFAQPMVGSFGWCEMLSMELRIWPVELPDYR